MNLIRPMLDRDVSEMVSVHLVSFPNFFLTFMGPRFLDLLYREIYREPGNVCLIAEAADGGLIGFVVGVRDQVGLYKRLASRRWFAFAIASAGTVVRHPSVLPRLLRALTYSDKASTAACPALLMSIAVSPRAMGTGVGQALVNEFLHHMAQHGVDNICLTTDRDNNEATNRFYRKCGFAMVREFMTPEGRAMNEYTIQTKRDQP
jgi:ribosomal protein S18 acetylase RimI-like enzyme